MRRAARRGHEVLFVESGSFLWRDAGRILRHPWKELRDRLAGRFAEDDVRVRSALNVLPWGKKYELASRINFRFTAVMLRRTVRRLRQPPTVLWIYDPCAASMINKLGEAFAVYDCVDDYSQQYAPDLRRMALVAAADKVAGERSRIVFATTEPLADRHRRANPRTYLVSNAADYPHFSLAANRGLADAEVRDLARPVIGFAGNLEAGKVDFSLLTTLATERPSWTLLLIGPVRAGAEGAVERLAKLPNVRWLGWKPYEELPRYVASFDVGLCPYLANAYMQNVFPLKVYEYLAAGKSVVATGTPSLSGMEPDVVVVDGPDALLSALEAALDRSAGTDIERRMALAARNTWEGRTERLLGLISAELEGRAEG